ncbi:MAG: hypothetical protein M3R37_07865 [Actinomycetota bacterium]|nr:hypothetical protein [Actinomycetota bacterium]
MRLTRGLAQVEHPHRPLAFQDGQVVEATLGNQVTAASIEVAADTAIGSAVIHSRTRASFGWTPASEGAR